MENNLIRLINKLHILCCTQRNNQAHDIIYDIFDDLFKNGVFYEANNLIKCFKIEEWKECDDILIAVLTATLPAKSKLPYRAIFFESVDNYFNDKELLKGLE